MNCLHLLYLIPLLHSGLGSLPAPVNVSVSSHNFYHVLQWKPHPGTPTGTLYKIYNSVNKRRRLLNSTTASSLELKLDIFKQSDLFVLASYNGTESKSKTVTFTPFKDTKIGPAEVSLATCGNCIEINISLPNDDVWSDKDFYNDPLFIIYWKKKNEIEPHSLQTRKKSYTLDNLEKGREYCVNVEIEIRTNKNTLPSESKCIFTSVESRRDTAVLGAVSAVLILVIGFLMTSIYFLYYTGYLCKGQTSLPKALVYQPVQPVKLNTKGKQTGDQEMIHYQMALIQGYTMTPENIDSCLISISSEMENQRVHGNPTAQYPAMWQAISEEEEEEEEDDEEENVYMDRNANLSSSESSCRGSFKRLGTSKLGISEDCGSLTERPSATMEVPAAKFDIGVVHAGLDQCEPEAEEATVSFLSERIQSGVQGHVISEEEEKMKEKVEVCENSGNVDLFSVTLATLTAAEEEDQSKTDFLTVTDPTHPSPTVSGLTLSTTEYETESDHEMTVPTMQPTHQDFTETWYKGRHAETQSSSSEEEEEEEEFSGYMAHI
ncbi:cytokine receptor family member b1 isoform X2 [Channa argus]|uniref:cytokine receptor family member b1 isoform X2 n=1 Tax=Channa argus TaxID=215402 RepID=UPI003520A42C